MPTVSFHLGREISTIDLAASAITPAQLEAAERRTNEIIFADREIKILYGTAEELAAVGVRKQVERTGVLRAIEVEGLDRSPAEARTLPAPVKWEQSFSANAKS